MAKKVEQTDITQQKPVDITDTIVEKIIDPEKIPSHIDKILRNK